jgi:osmotically-inducible protein OsmY
LPSYRGVGPKSYTRSDERLNEEICERLTDHPRIDASDIDVQVNQGEVTLTGTVRDKSAKWHVEDLVMSCRGVTDVNNRLRTNDSRS